MNYDKIKRTGILFLLGIGAITSLSCNDNDNANYPERVPTRLSVMPLPERVDYKESVVSLPQNVTVSQNIPASTSQLLKSTLEEKLSLSVSDASNDRAFIRVKQEADLAKEAYRLTVTKEGACVYYSTETGLLWGIQTLRQALEQANFFTSGSAKYLPMVDIKDAPKYDWRGFHIDVVRHMFTVDYLKKVIDCLSFYKINKLHLHLTDDQGWRIEVKKYPLLTQEGSWRDFDEYDKRCVELSQQDYNYEIDPRFVRNGSQYGGHYTQEEMKGLEFKNVFVVGLEENLFPSGMVGDSPRALEEERRLFYVAITRAEEHCYLSFAKTRFRYGKMEFGSPSRFLRDIDVHYLQLPHEAGVSRAVDEGAGRFRREIEGGFTRSASPSRASFGSTSSEQRERPKAQIIAPSVPRNLKKVSTVTPSSGAQATSSTSPSVAGVQAGQMIEHERFGLGEVIKVEGTGDNAKATIHFKNAGDKQLLLRFARFKVVE